LIDRDVHFSKAIMNESRMDGILTKYRHRFDILADIVRVAGTGSRKTKIMYIANLSFALLNKYLKDALHVGFLQSDGEQYLMTKKGEAFLERYQQFSSRYSAVKADVEKLRCEAEALDEMCRSRRGSNKGARRKEFAVLG
jgi:predicted transcriptional regulator